MVYDAAFGTIVLFGGVNGSAVLGDTWSWNGSNWTQLASAGSGSPPTRDNASAAYDTVHEAIVLFGGDIGLLRLGVRYLGLGAARAGRLGDQPELGADRRRNVGDYHR